MGWGAQPWSEEEEGWAWGSEEPCTPALPAVALEKRIRRLDLRDSGCLSGGFKKCTFPVLRVSGSVGLEGLEIWAFQKFPW